MLRSKRLLCVFTAFVFSLLLNLYFVRASQADPLTITGNNQMSVKGSQTLTVSGGTGPYTWSIESGSGNLSGSSGNSTSYTAPNSNPYLANNPTIRVTDSTGEWTDFQIAVNANPNNYVAYMTKSCVNEAQCVTAGTPGCQSPYGCCHCATVKGWGYKCDGSPYYSSGAPICGADGTFGNWGPPYACQSCACCISYICADWRGMAGMSASCSSSDGMRGSCGDTYGHQGEFGTIIDLRSDSLIASGCSPAALLGSSVGGSDPGTNSTGNNCSNSSDMGSSANLKSGNLYLSQDIAKLTLSYNSIDTINGPLGKKWTHNYNQQLLALNDSALRILKTEDGNSIYFRLSGGVFYPENRSGDTSRIIKNTNGTYTRTAKNGTIYNYNSSGYLITITDRNGNTTTLTYNSSGYLAGITDQNGRITNITTTNGIISAITDPGGKTYNLAYTNGLLTSITDPQGFIWHYTYDSSGRMLTKKDPGNFTVTYTYGAGNKLLTSTDPEGKVRTMNYNTVGTSTFTEKDGGLWHYTYDPIYAVKTAKTDPLGHATHYTYDNKRNLLTTTYPDGSTTGNTYDANSNVTSSTDQLGNVTHYTYNSLNLVASQTDARGATTNYTYDVKGNLLSVTDPLGAITSFIYDAKGNRTSMTNANGKTTTMAYDSHNNLTGTTDPAGAVTSFTYDAAGNRLTMTDPLGNITHYTYNNLNQMTQVTDPKNNITYYTYDYKGNVLAATDANGNPTHYAYNYRGQVTQITDALNNLTKMSYGPAGCGSGCGGADKLTALTDALNHVTGYTYDAAGRLLSETDPQGGQTSYTYDAKGNMLSKTKPDGRSITYTYDAKGRLLQKTYPDSTVNTFTYDQNGNMTMAANAWIAYYYTYDLSNRLTGVTDSNLRAITYQYDQAGNRTSMTTPENLTTTYTYDNAGRLSTLANSTGTYALSYDNAGRRTSLAYPNGVTAAYSYDQNSNLMGIVHTISGNTVAQALYTYDNVNNRISKTATPGLANAGYSYDAIYRLNQTTQGEAYSYDAVGNRLTGPNATDSLSYNTGNELLNLNTATYTYDANGNRISKSDGTTYTYDDENRLTQVTSGSTTITYTYDPLGRRLTKTVNGITTTYLYDNQSIILEYQSGNVITRYTQGLGVDEHLAVQQSTGTYYYHADGLGSIVALTDATGAVVQTYSYDSFGNMTKTTAISQPYTYTGREYDNQTDLYFYRARYYDPKAGRFITKDPIGFEGGDVNFYAYVSNNPVNYTDPEGLHMVCDKIHGCYFHTSCINDHEHPNRDATQGRCFDFDPPVNIPPWLCKMGITAGCGYLCKRLGGKFATCQAKCRTAAELICPKKCE